MGIVVKQSSRNTIIIFIAFAIGGINTLFLYTEFLTPQYYGLVVFLLSAANLLMPFTAFGIQHAIVKFFPSYQTKLEKDTFLSSVLFLPLFIAIPMGFLGVVFYEKISAFLAVKNEIIQGYTYVIYFVAIATAYFEIFYAWAKVQMQSVSGNALKELYHRVSTLLLLVLIAFDVINVQQFIWLLMVSYFLRTLLMLIHAFKLYTPKFTFQKPHNFKEILTYAIYIILAGSAGAILLEIDKVMLPSKKAIELTAYYTVGVFIASVVEVPGRAMHQILQPLTSKAIQEQNITEVASLYKRSSINLIILCSLIFLLININIVELYKIVPKEDYSQGVFIVLMISIAKLYNMFLGNNGAIIANSKYYKILLPYGIAMAIIVAFLNHWWIDVFGMNGAALSTLVVIFIFNTLKIWYVKRKFNMLPFTWKTLQLAIIIAILFMAFYFWNFSFHPILNIGLKSCLLIVIYAFIVKKMAISKEVNELLSKYLKLKSRKYKS